MNRHPLKSLPGNHTQYFQNSVTWQQLAIREAKKCHRSWDIIVPNNRQDLVRKEKIQNRQLTVNFRLCDSMSALRLALL